MQSPQGWGEDDLSAFVEQAERNTRATFANLKQWFTLLRNTDSLFIGATQIPCDWGGNPLPALLLMRAQASFRGAVRLAMSGQLPEAYMVTRGCIENSLYAAYVRSNDRRAEIWLRRNDSADSRNLVRKTFVYGELLTHLRVVDAATADRVDLLYQFAIDSGAHPNELSISANTTISEVSNGVRFDLKYLNTDPLPLKLCLKKTAQAGLASIEVFQVSFPQEFMSNGLTARLHELCRKL